MKEEVRNGIILAICVILILVVVYLATAIFMTGEIGSKKNKNKSSNTTDVSSTEDEYNNLIIASSIFSRAESNYMVVIFSKKSASNELKDAITGYSKDTKLYVVNMDEAINSDIKGDSDNLVKDGLKVKDSALLIIENGDISSSVIGGVEIIKKLK